MFFWQLSIYLSFHSLLIHFFIQIFVIPARWNSSMHPLIYPSAGPSCSKLGQGTLGLVWNLISGLKTLRENSVQIFLLAIWSLDVLKRIVKIFPKRLLNKEIKKPGLKFNPGLGLIGLWTTGPCSLLRSFVQSFIYSLI